MKDNEMGGILGCMHIEGRRLTEFCENNAFEVLKEKCGSDP
jgi:hypothetical protein